MLVNPSLAGLDDVLSVTQLNRRVNNLLENQFARVWVRGEISNFTQAASGHWYFTVKDEQATVRGVMFRSRAATVGFVPKVGERFEFLAGVTLYEARGEYQLQVQRIRRAGQGDLHEAFLALKKKLADQGLFDAERKLPIKAMPRALGVVTSIAAAALHDVLTALARRAPHVNVIVYPAPVRGLDAGDKLVSALQTAIDRNEVDTLLLVRGGGSLEDLWSFNNEYLARAIAASPIPVISGVGHETDFTIADFVADLRAPTPTAAAEMSSLSRQDCLDEVSTALNSLTRQLSRLLERASLRLDRAVAGLVSPQQRLTQQNRRLVELRQMLARAATRPHQQHQARLSTLVARLRHVRPDTAGKRRELDHARQCLLGCAPRQLVARQARLASARYTLEALNPRKILARGYAIVRTEDGLLIKNAVDLNEGDRLSLEFGQGGADVKVLRPRSLI